jgi:hypothetical protein
VGVHILIDRYAVCVIGTGAWHNKTASPLLGRCGARRAPRHVATYEVPKAARYQNRVRIKKPITPLFLIPGIDTNICQ